MYVVVGVQCSKLLIPNISKSFQIRIYDLQCIFTEQSSQKKTRIRLIKQKHSKNHFLKSKLKKTTCMISFIPKYLKCMISMTIVQNCEMKTWSDSKSSATKHFKAFSNAELWPSLNLHWPCFIKTHVKVLHKAKTF